MKQMTSQTALDAYTEVVDEIHITLAMLENMPSGARACSPARHWFQKNFPNGGERAEVWPACPNWRWQVWFAVHSATTEEAVAFAQSCAERAAVYAEHAVAKADDADADAAEAAYAAHAARAAAARAARAAAAYAAAARAYAEHAAETAYAAHAARAAYDAARAAEAAYAAHAAYDADADAGADVDEIQVQVAWARRILFS